MQMKSIFVALIVLVGVIGLGRCITAQDQKQPPQQPPKQQMSIPADAVFYQDVSWSPDNSRIVFTLLKDAQWNLYVMRADGSQTVRLTLPEGLEGHSPNWSPDGKHIAFNARRGQGAQSDIYLIGADGTGLKQLTSEPSNDTAPAWSPDGKRITFTSNRDGLHQIYVMNADGSAQSRVLHDETRDFNPQWSPDGKRLLFYAEKGDHKDQVWVMNADGSNPTLLTGGVGHNIFPAWSPDGRTIIFCAQRDGAEKTAIYTMATDGTGIKRLTEANGFYARFSPDGARVAFTTQGFPQNALYVVRADGTNLKRLTP
jgi:tol-pal system beta propeller repeat protein TolB